MGAQQRISIVLATWNGETFLSEQLESYLAQSVLPDELVVSDDASRDGTISVVKEFAKRAPFPVRVLENNERVGYAQNFVRAIKASTGDILFLSDQDDIWLPNHIERLLGPFVHSDSGNSNVALTVSRSRHFRVLADGSRHEWDPCRGTVRKTWDWRQCHRYGMVIGYVRQWCMPFFGHGMAVARHVLEKYPPPPESDWHDRWIAVVASAIGEFVYFDEVLTLHRVHGRNTAGTGHRRPLSFRRRLSFDKHVKNLQAFIDAMQYSELTSRGRRSLAVARQAVEGYKARARARQLGWRGILTCCNAFARGYYRYAGQGFYSFARDIIEILLHGGSQDGVKEERSPRRTRPSKELCT